MLVETGYGNFVILTAMNTNTAESVNNTDETTTSTVTQVTPTEGAENTSGTEAVPADTTSSQAANNSVVVQTEGDNTGMQAGMAADPTMQTGMAGGKASLLSSWPFVGGITGAVLLVSIAIGALLAHRKIKKGIEIYED